MSQEPRVYRREAGPQDRWRWGRVVGSLVIATVLGVAAGLLVPLNGQSAAPRLLQRLGLPNGSLALPVMPWQGRGTVDPAVAAVVRRQGLFSPAPWPLLTPPARPLYGQPLLPRDAADPGPPSRFRRACLAPLDRDPLALPLSVAWRSANNRLEPRPIDPVARLAHVPVMMYHDVVEGDKGVWFDATVEEFDRDLALLEQAGVTPISLRQWWGYITRAQPLPKKPILLTFDDGYASVYHLIYPRLKQRRWPAVFFITTSTVGRRTGRDHLTWDQMREMRETGLFEFQAHSVTHPYLTQVSERQLQQEVLACRDALENELGVPIQFFCYPIGDRNERVISTLKNAGFVAGFTMQAGASASSPSIMEINRYPNQELAAAIAASDGSMALRVPAMWPRPDLTQPLVFQRSTFNERGNRIPICWVRGGKVTTVHADFRYAVPDVARLLRAPAGINGGFFQLAHVRDISNAMIGPVMASWTTTRNEAVWRTSEVAEPASALTYHRFVPGSDFENERLIGRPLVLISPTAVRFVPFQGSVMNSQRALEMILPGVTDAFIGGGWLVREGRALSRGEMDLAATRDHHDPRRRAFFGIDLKGRPVIGASPSSQSSETIARCLVKLGVAQAVLLDSGFSSSLYYNGSIFVSGHSDEKPSRPVPHIILLQLPDDPVNRALGPAVTKTDSLVRLAEERSEADEMPPQSRLVDVDQKPLLGVDEDRFRR